MFWRHGNKRNRLVSADVSHTGILWYFERTDERYWSHTEERNDEYIQMSYLNILMTVQQDAAGCWKPADQIWRNIPWSSTGRQTVHKVLPVPPTSYHWRPALFTAPCPTYYILSCHSVDTVTQWPDLRSRLTSGWPPEVSRVFCESDCNVLYVSSESVQSLLILHFISLHVELFTKSLLDHKIQWYSFFNTITQHTHNLLPTDAT